MYHLAFLKISYEQNVFLEGDEMDCKLKTEDYISL